MIKKKKLDLLYCIFVLLLLLHVLLCYHGPLPVSSLIIVLLLEYSFVIKKEHVHFSPGGEGKRKEEKK